jgi:hypothetical protein
MQLKDHPEFRKLTGELVPVPEPPEDEPSHKLIKRQRKAAPKVMCLKCRTYCPCECGDNLTKL